MDVIINVNADKLRGDVKKDPNILKLRDGSSLTLLLFALKMEEDNSHGDKVENEKVVNLLLKNSDLKVTDNNKFSLLYYAVFNEKYVRFLLDNEAYANIKRDEYDIYGLTKAIGQGYSKSVKLLLEHNYINNDIKDSENYNLLHILAYGIVVGARFEAPLHDSNQSKKLQIIEEYKEIFNLLKL